MAQPITTGTPAIVVIEQVLATAAAYNKASGNVKKKMEIIKQIVASGGKGHSMAEKNGSERFLKDLNDLENELGKLEEAIKNIGRIDQESVRKLTETGAYLTQIIQNFKDLNNLKKTEMTRLIDALQNLVQLLDNAIPVTRNEQRFMGNAANPERRTIEDLRNLISRLPQDPSLNALRRAYNDLQTYLEQILSLQAELNEEANKQRDMDFRVRSSTLKLLGILSKTLTTSDVISNNQVSAEDFKTNLGQLGVDLHQLEEILTESLNEIQHLISAEEYIKQYIIAIKQQTNQARLGGVN